MTLRFIQSLCLVAALAALVALAVAFVQRRGDFNVAAAPTQQACSGDMLLSVLAAAQVQAQTPPGANAQSQNDDGDGMPARGDREPWSQEMIDRCLDVAHDIDPDLASQLAQKRQKNPDEFESTVQRGQVGRRLQSMVQLKVRDPDLYRLKISEMTQTLQINRVAAKLQQAMQSSDLREAEALKNQLRQLLQIQLAMSLKSRAEYLCRIEEQVQRLREEIDHDAANFRTIVEARIQQVLQQPHQTDAAAVIPAAGRPARPHPPR